MIRVLLLGAVLAACGRISFDARDDATVPPVGDGPGAITDAPIRATFGETGMATYSNVTSDTYVTLGFPTFNYGSAGTVASSGVGGGTGLLRFDISAIPATATVMTATLDVYLEVPSGTGMLDGYPVVEAWDEGDVEGVDGVANWTVRVAPNVMWTSAGAGTNSINNAETFTTLPVAGGRTFLPDMAIVQGWVSNPSTNFGFAFNCIGCSDTVQFTSSESAFTAQRPLLTVLYTL